MTFSGGVGYLTSYVCLDFGDDMNHGVDTGILIFELFEFSIADWAILTNFADDSKT